MNLNHVINSVYDYKIKFTRAVYSRFMKFGLSNGLFRDFEQINNSIGLWLIKLASRC